MQDSQRLLIFGASTRAAAFSALRAGLQPWCADLFADADLQAVCSVRRLSTAQYPKELLRVARAAPAGPCMYTGALENRPGLIRALSNVRPLWGNDAAVLSLVRSPQAWTDLLRGAGFSVPEICLRAEELPSRGRWLVKKRRSAAGTGIHFWTGEPLPGRSSFLQEWIAGEDHAAVFVGEERHARLLGVTRQLVGAQWLHARPFAYCGSIGPLSLPDSVQKSLEKLGAVLVQRSGLRGVFGVDFVLRDEVAWPVEINPRYTASVEVLEHGLGQAALAEHARAFASSLVSGSGGRASPGCETGGLTASARPSVFGKAILFARAALRFPEAGPWKEEFSPWRVPSFADIPCAGQYIEAGQPVLTFFARASSVSSCRDALRQFAEDLDSFLWKT